MHILDTRRPGKQVQLAENEIRCICLMAKEVFMSQPALLELEAPIKICGAKCAGWAACHSARRMSAYIVVAGTFAGDIHGQYSDLLRLFEYGGFPPEANYLFLGDYVDRGKQSLETICLLLAFKVCMGRELTMLLLQYCLLHAMQAMLIRAVFSRACVLRSSTLRTSSCCAGTTSALPSTVSMASTTSASAATTFVCGGLSQIASTACQRQLSLTRRCGVDRRLDGHQLQEHEQEQASQNNLTPLLSVLCRADSMHARRPVARAQVLGAD